MIDCVVLIQFAIRNAFKKSLEFATHPVSVSATGIFFYEK